MPKNYIYPFLLLLMAAAFAACNKGSDDVQQQTGTSTLNVINAVTDVKAIDFYLNGTRQNTNSAIYLFNASGYLNVVTGEQQYQFKRDTDRSILTDIKLNPAKADSSYTLVLAGHSGPTLFPIFISDYFPSDTLGRAQVRFVQASPGSVSYDVMVGDTLAFKNQAYQAYTSFQPVGAGKKYVHIRLAGSNADYKLDSIIIQPRTYYTLYTRGVQGGTGNDALGVSINVSR